MLDMARRIVHPATSLTVAGGIVTDESASPDHSAGWRGPGDRSGALVLSQGEAGRVDAGYREAEQRGQG